MTIRPMIVALALTLGVTGCSQPRTADSLANAARESKPRSGAPQSASSVEAPTDVPTDVPTDIEDGRDIFLDNCTGCHGREADANTPAGKAWHVPNLRSPEVQQTSDGQLLEVMSKGKGRMPAWGGILSPIDLQHLLAYVRSLKHP
jgi:cytochrome c oxidase cbb3-type subunit 3